MALRLASHRPLLRLQLVATHFLPGDSYPCTRSLCDCVGVDFFECAYICLVALIGCHFSSIGCMSGCNRCVLGVYVGCTNVYKSLPLLPPFTVIPFKGIEGGIWVFFFFFFKYKKEGRG